MGNRSKILGILFGAFVAYAAIAGVVYPRWIGPLVTIDKRIAEKRTELDKLKRVEDQVRQAKKQYQDSLVRIGSFDIGKVETDLRERLNGLIEKHQLRDVNVSPTRPTKDRKTGLGKMTITVNSTGTLKSGIEFLRDVAALPQLVRAGNAAIYPAARRSKDRGPVMMNIRVPVELIVLPEKTAAGKIDLRDDPQPEEFARHLERDYSVIWDREPFTDYVPLQPLRVVAGQAISKRVGSRRVKMGGKVTGGKGMRSCVWTPSDYLKDPKSLTTGVDCSKAFSQTYTLTATDEKGKTASATVRVEVTEKRSTVRKDPPKPPPEDPGPKRFRQGGKMQFVMALFQNDGTVRRGELMVFNKANKVTTYYTEGDDFDGGKIEVVHPRGAVVRRRDKLSAYVIGERLNADIDEEDPRLVNYPDLMAEIQRIRQDEATAAEAAKQQPEAAKGDADAHKDAANDPAKGVDAPAAATGPGGGTKGVKPGENAGKPAPVQKAVVGKTKGDGQVNAPVKRETRPRTNPSSKVGAPGITAPNANSLRRPGRKTDRRTLPRANRNPRRSGRAGERGAGGAEMGGLRPNSARREALLKKSRAQRLQKSGKSKKDAGAKTEPTGKQKPVPVGGRPAETTGQKEKGKPGKGPSGSGGTAPDEGR